MSLHQIYNLLCKYCNFAILSYRKQVVSVGKETCHYCPITSGVPHGSILGPLLFFLFINHLPEVFFKTLTNRHANDTAMYFSTTNSQVIANTLINELALVNKWLIDNNLFMHKGKTECMLFGTGPRLALSTSFLQLFMEKHLIALLRINILGLFSMRRLRGMCSLNT